MEATCPWSIAVATTGPTHRPLSMCSCSITPHTTAPVTSCQVGVREELVRGVTTSAFLLVVPYFPVVILSDWGLLHGPAWEWSVTISGVLLFHLLFCWVYVWMGKTSRRPVDPPRHYGSDQTEECPACAAISCRHCASATTRWPCCGGGGWIERARAWWGK